MSPSARRPFQLTHAVRPAADARAWPVEGYRLDRYRGRHGDQDIPAVAAAVSAPRLIPAFFRLLEPLGPVVDIVLESTHEGDDRPRVLKRRSIDRPVLESYLHEYEDVLTHDGCAGVAVIASNRPREVQLDEHKLILVYAANRRPFLERLEAVGLRRWRRLPLICEEPHLHRSAPELAERFRRMAVELGASETVNWVAG